MVVMVKNRRGRGGGGGGNDSLQPPTPGLDRKVERSTEARYQCLRSK